MRDDGKRTSRERKAETREGMNGGGREGSRERGGKKRKAEREKERERNRDRRRETRKKDVEFLEIKRRKTSPSRPLIGPCQY